MNVASDSVKCKRFVCILLAICVSKVNFGEVVYLAISRLSCLTTKLVCCYIGRFIHTNISVACETIVDLKGR